MKTTPQAFRRYGSRLGLVMAVVLAVGAFATAGSAAASTQHWASLTQKSFSGSQSFTGQASGNIILKFTYAGASLTVTCEQWASSGTATNPEAGGSGTLGPVALALESCGISAPSCSIENGRIAFESLVATTSEEAGKHLISFVPEYGTTATVLHFNGVGCPLGSSVYVSGSIVASELSPGQYKLEPELSHLYTGSMVYTPQGNFKLSNTSKEALALSSVETPGILHWVVSQWTNLAAGKSSSYASSGSMSFGIRVKIALGTVNITCAGTSNGIAGSVENPGGGGAGSATGSFTLNECSLSGASHCTMQFPVKSVELTGVAGEVGGLPAIELSPREGTTVVKFLLGNSAEGICTLGTSISVTGKLIATSEGNGNFGLAPSELKVGTQNATTSGIFALKSGAGEYLRLQP